MSADETISQEIRELLGEYRDAADAEVKHLGKYATARVYGEGERPGAVLAQLLKTWRSKTQVSELKSAKGDVLTEETEIAGRFKQFYAELYSARSVGTEDEITDYLAHIKLPFLTNTHREYLMRPIEKDDILLALSSMKVGSAPGADGLTVAFYKAFLDLLLPHLMELFEDMCVTGTMPPMMREAVIVAILKPDKPSVECGSYRPLSLLNVDTNIFAKILANRLTPLVQILVAPEQAGFVPYRNLTYNLRTVFGALQHTSRDARAVAVFLDMEKAFDSVEWPFMRQVLTKMGLGPVFLQLIGVLYNSPTARIKVGHLVTDPIAITRGTRQGCPLSPILYALVAEPLARALREYHSHKGIRFPN